MVGTHPVPIREGGVACGHIGKDPTGRSGGCGSSRSLSPRRPSFAGLGLASAPFLFGYASDRQALADAVVVGALFSVFGVWRRLRPQRAFQLLRTTVAVAGWAIVAPFLFDYRTSIGTWIGVAVGGTVMAISVWGLLADHRRARGRAASSRTARWN
jgi:hypothetical protein